MGVPLDPLAPVWHYESDPEGEETAALNPLIGSINATSLEDPDESSLGLPLKMPNQEVIVHDLRGRDFSAPEPRKEDRRRDRKRKHTTDALVDKINSTLK